MKTLTGIIRGKTIELTESPGIDEGETVLVQVMLVNGGPPKGSWPHGGAMGHDWTDEDDQILASIHAERRAAAGRGLPE